MHLNKAARKQVAVAGFSPPATPNFQAAFKSQARSANLLFSKAGAQIVNSALSEKRDPLPRPAIDFERFFLQDPRREEALRCVFFDGDSFDPGSGRPIGSSRSEILGNLLATRANVDRRTFS